jgi:hypothetical protein
MPVPNTASVYPFCSMLILCAKASTPYAHPETIPYHFRIISGSIIERLVREYGVFFLEPTTDKSLVSEGRDPRTYKKYGDTGISFKSAGYSVSCMVMIRTCNFLMISIILFVSSMALASSIFAIFSSLYQSVSRIGWRIFS